MRELGFVFILITAVCLTKGLAQTPINIIPKPDSIVNKVGSFTFSRTTLISSEITLDRLSEYLSQELQVLTKISPQVNDSPGLKKTDVILLSVDSTFVPPNPEGYFLEVSTKEVLLRARTDTGLFRGIQTLLQLFPLADSVRKGESYSIPCCTIIDYPRFTWRGLNLDCCRHFMTKDFIKRYIDLLAYYKFDVFHWHLTDDQGWRIEIKKYPKLTQIGAWRKEADGTVYGGFYSQDDIKDVVAYAQSRFITVVPEIEMPGHCTASLAAYPENSCTGGPFAVGIRWGVYKDVYCAGKESTFTFLENVLTEVMDLFPSHYIHIGGDEVPKDRWKVCPFCQKRIKDEGLKDEEGLQSYFMKRIEKFVESRGREVIGWDEILEGGLGPDATVQSWRGIDGAIQAAQSQHNTIVSPEGYTYLNRSADELGIDTVYSFDPVPKGLSVDESRYVLGTEANMWSEQAPQETIDSKLFPRILALSEIAWTQPQKKNYDDFHKRLEIEYDRLAYLGVNFGPEKQAILFQTKLDTTKDEFTISLKAGQGDSKIHYTLDGSLPTRSSFTYEEPLIIKNSTELSAQLEMRGRLLGSPVNLAFTISKTLNSKISLKTSYSEKYPSGGPGSLVDGIRGTMDFHDGFWQGYEGVDIKAIIDLGKEEEISQAGAGFFQATDSWIFMPDSVEFFVSSDGVNFINVGVVRNDVPQKDPDPVKKDFVVSFDKKTTRYIKMVAKNIGICPPWHDGAGGKAWLFIDEIFAN